MSAEAEGARARAATKDAVKKDFMVFGAGAETHDFFENVQRKKRGVTTKKEKKAMRKSLQH